MINSFECITQAKKNQDRVTLRVSAASIMSDVTFDRAVSVEWCAARGIYIYIYIYIYTTCGIERFISTLFTAWIRV